MVKAVDGLVDILKSEGVGFVSTFPTTSINNAVGAADDIDLFMVRDERYAVACADAYSRLMNGKAFGVCTVMGGINAAGTQMAYGALAQAYEDSVPLLCLTDGVEPEAYSRTRYSINQGFSSVTKYNGYVNRPERVPEFLRRAFTHLKTGRPSPVLLQVPRNLDQYDPDAHPYTPVKGWRSMGDPRDVERAVRALKAARRPLLWAGQGVFRADACAELKEFAELAKLPVLTTLNGKSVFPESHPLSVGVRGEPATRFLVKADLVLTVGVGLTPSHFMHKMPPGKRLIQCTVDGSDVNNDYTADHVVLGDAKLTLRQLTEELQRQGAPTQGEALVAEIVDARAVMSAKYLPFMESGDRPVNPYRVYAEMQAALDPLNSFVTHESGNTRDQLSAVYRSEIPHGFLGWGNVSTLGYGLGAAMGAWHAFKDREIVAVTGDAGVGYQMGNWETLTRYGMGVTLLHINNDGFGGYGSGFWGAGHSPYTCDLTGSETQSTARVAEALGIASERVSDPDEVAPALKRALKANMGGKPYLLEVICCKHPVYPAWVK